MTKERDTACSDGGRAMQENLTPECRRIGELVWPYLDHELPRSQQRAVAAHLSHCVCCRGLFDFHRAFLRTVRSSVR